MSNTSLHRSDLVRSPSWSFSKAPVTNQIPAHLVPEKASTADTGNVVDLTSDMNSYSEQSIHPNTPEAASHDMTAELVVGEASSHAFATVTVTDSSSSDHEDDAPTIDLELPDFDVSSSTSDGDEPLASMVGMVPNAASLEVQHTQSTPTQLNAPPMSTGTSSGLSDTMDNHKPSPVFEDLPEEILHYIIEYHLSSDDKSLWECFGNAGIILLRFDGQYDWVSRLGNWNLLRKSRKSAAVSLNVLYGTNSFVLFAKEEGGRRLPQYRGYQELHDKFLLQIGPHNVERMRKLTLSGNTRLGSERAPNNEISLRQLTRLNPGLANLQLLVLEACLLDYVIKTPVELDDLIQSDYIGHLNHVRQAETWDWAVAFEHHASIKEICRMVNSSIWSAMVLNNAKHVRTFWPRFKFVYEIIEDEVRCLVLSAKPLRTQYPAQNPPSSDCEGLDDGLPSVR